MIRRPAPANLLPVRLRLDGQDSTVYLRPPNADDLAGLPAGIKASLVGEVAAAKPPPTVEEEAVEAIKPGKRVKPAEPETLERVAESFMRRFQTPIASAITDPEKVTALGSALLSALAERGQASAQDEDAAARNLLVRCVVAQDDDAGNRVPLRFVALAAEEEADPLHTIWIGHFPSVRALYPAIKEAIVRATPTFRP